MNRQQKEEAVALIKDYFGKSQAAFLINYKGVDVTSLQALRRGLRDDQGLLKVTKACLMKIAAQDIEGADEFINDFKNQVGLVFALGDASGIAKKLVEFSKENETFDVVSGFFEKRLLSKEQIASLASLPSRDVLLAQCLGTLQAPISSFARLLQMMIIRLLFVLKQISEQQAE